MLFIFQGLLVIILSLPLFLVCFSSHSHWTYWEAWGILVWLIGMIGEYFTGTQLSTFQDELSNKGKVCWIGLRHLIRHLNYFFEWVIWIGFTLFAIPSDGGGLAIISPLIMLLLLFRASEMPLVQVQALRSRGEAYREGQRTVSAFLPWFPKKPR